ncbi:MAG: peptidylprolyl isomerase [Proteobacteria bacterium]|nr:peptidylprolyl isomerase [Pseudomonadota bacterium]
MRNGKLKLTAASLAFAGVALTAAAAEPPAKAPQAFRHVAVKAVADILAASKPSEWRRLDPENTLYLDLPGGRVVIELAPGFAPHHVANIKALVRAGYFDNAAIIRSQDNYVVQWGQPDEKRSLGPAKKTLKAEFDRRIGKDARLDRLQDPDTYAPEVGFAQGFPAARNRKLGREWLTHCYGVVGVGRDEGADSGGGTELYAVNGQAPRHLDRNVTLVGRVVQGMELLSVMPRGTGDLGFYKTTGEQTPIRRIRVAADLPASERTELEALRTDSATFKTLMESRRNRREPWFKVPAGRLGVCNAPLPVRPAKG